MNPDVDRYTFGTHGHLALRLAPCLAGKGRAAVTQDQESCAPARPSADAFLRMLHSSGGSRDLRAIHPQDNADPRVITRSVPASDLAGVHHFMETFGGERNLYVGVASRNGHGRRVEHCLTLDVLFVDLDVKEFTGGEAEARTRLEAFPLEPTAVVTTGGGRHVYWWLLEPIDLQRDGAAVYAKAILRTLATQLKADLDAAEPARVLRLPGTLNHKYRSAASRRPRNVRSAPALFTRGLHRPPRARHRRPPRAADIDSGARTAGPTRHPCRRPHPTCQDVARTTACRCCSRV